jgi:hypothetical protein
MLGLIVWLAACAPASGPASAPSPVATPVSPLPRPISPLPTPAGEMSIAPIQIESVEVRIAESFPVQVSAYVRGVIGDGCSSVLPAVQERQGNTITLTINRQRPADAICIQIAKVYEETIRLEGDFPPGEYVLKVNDVTQNFKVD